MVKRIISLTTFLLLMLSAFAEAKIYVDEDFSDADTGIVALVEKSENGKINYVRIDDGYNNGYVKMTSTFEGDCIINLPFNTPISGNIVMEADFFVESCPGNLQLFYIRQVRDSQRYDTALWRVSDNVLSAGGKCIPLEKGRWYHGAVIMDVANGTAEHYLDNILIEKGQLSNKAYTAIDNVWMRYVGTEGAVAGIDNIKVYRGSSIKKISDEAVLINESFDMPGAEYTKGEKTDSSGVKNTIEESGGALKLIKRSNQEDCFVDFGLNTASDNIVMEADVMVNSSSLGAYLFYLRDGKSNHTGNVSQHIVTMSDGSFKATRTKVASGINKWHKMKLVLDLKNHKYTLTCGSNKAEGTIDTKINRLSILRFYVTAGTGTGELAIDNLKVYTGDVRDISEEEKGHKEIEEGLLSLDYLSSFLGDAKAFFSEGGFIFDGVKKYPEEGLYKKESEYYIGINDFIKLTGKNVSVNGDTVSCDGREYTIGRRAVIENGTERFSEHYPERSKNGVIMVPFKEFAKGVVYTEFDSGLVVVGKDITGGVYVARYLGAFLKRDATTYEELSHFAALNGMKHPSIMADSESFERAKNASDKTVIKWRDGLIKKADDVLASPPLEYKIADGLRLLSVAQDFNNRITLLGFAWRLTGDVKYYNEAYELMHTVGEFPDWNSKLHFLDTAEMTFGAAVYYDWFYEKHSTDEKQYVKNALDRMAFEPAIAVYKGTYDGSSFWRQTTTNWGMICNGAIGMAALALMEENPEYYSDILRCALHSLDFMWYELQPDGGWHEGVGYWEYTYAYMARFFSSLTNTIGRDTGYLKGNEIEGYGYFRRYLTTQNGADSFDDSFEYQYSDFGGMWLAKAKNNSDFAKMREEVIEKGYTSADVMDVLWYDEASASALNIEKDKLFKSINSAVFRDSFEDDKTLYFALHGGKNSEPHSHYDGGTFTYEIDGVRWTKDPGYALGASGNNPYGKQGLYRARTEGHSTVVINPSLDIGQDTDGVGVITRFESSGGEAVAVLDMGSFYKSQVNSFNRAAFIDNDRRTVTLRDEISLKQASDVYWFMQTDATVTKVSDKLYKLSEGGKSIYLSFTSNAQSVRLEAGEAKLLPQSPQVSGQPNDQGMKRIAIIASGEGDISITVRLTPDSDKTQIIEKAISDMTINPLYNGFNDGGNNGLFGKSDLDKSSYNKEVRKSFIPTDNMTVSFYAAFDDANKENNILMYAKSDFEDEEKAIPLIAFLPEGRMNLLGVDANVGGKAWMARKWYKTDILLNFTDGITASVYIDNKLIAKDIKAEMSVPDEICGFGFGMHADDIKVVSGEKTPQTITLVNTNWDYNKFLTTDKGIYAFESKEIPYDNTSLKTMVKNGVKTIETVRKEAPYESYYIITASDGGIIYAPVYGVGMRVGSADSVGNEELMTGADEGFGVTTADFIIGGNTPGKVYVFANGEWKEFVSVNATGVITAGGKVCKACADADTEVSVTVFPGKKIIEIYVDGEYIKYTAFSKNADKFGGIKFEFEKETIKNLLMHTGGRDNTIRYGDIEKKANVSKISFRSIEDMDAYLAGYFGDELGNVRKTSASGGLQEMELEGSFDEVKFFAWDEMKPKL